MGFFLYYLIHIFLFYKIRVTSKLDVFFSGFPYNLTIKISTYCKKKKFLIKILIFRDYLFLFEIYCYFI